MSCVTNVHDAKVRRCEYICTCNRICLKAILPRARCLYSFHLYGAASNIHTYIYVYFKEDVHKAKAKTPNLLTYLKKNRSLK